jgi:hypothetical protein
MEFVKLKHITAYVEIEKERAAIRSKLLSSFQHIPGRIETVSCIQEWQISAD